jgi:hypothetical protein
MFKAVYTAVAGLRMHLRQADVKSATLPPKFLLAASDSGPASDPGNGVDADRPASLDEPSKRHLDLVKELVGSDGLLGPTLRAVYDRDFSEPPAQFMASVLLACHLFSGVFSRSR